MLTFARIRTGLTTVARSVHCKLHHTPPIASPLYRPRWPLTAVAVAHSRRTIRRTIMDTAGRQADADVRPTITYDGVNYREIQEGMAVILAPEGARVETAIDEAEVQKVFYNPIQQFNRDLTVLAIKAFGEDYLQTKREKAKVQRQNQASRKRKRQEAGEEDKAERTETSEKGEKIARVGDGTGDFKIENEEALTSANKDTEGDVPPAPATETTQSEQRTNAQGPKFTILDALSATGLRALRYAHEIPFVTSVTANDITASAVESIKRHAAHNGLEDKIVTTNEDALAHMYRTIALDLSKRDIRGNPSETHRYNVIDLDPYGTAAPFIDAAVQGVKDGGLLAVTCTDSALFAGHGYSEKTFTLYGGVPVRGLFSHEAGLRLIINAVAQAGARHSLTVEPLLSLSIDYYCRIFLRVRRSQAAAKFLASKTMILYNCDQGCGSYQTQYFLKSKLMPTKNGNTHYYKHSMMQGPSSDTDCQHCGKRMHVAGPMYGGYIHSPEFIERLLAELPGCDPGVYGTLPRIEGMLTTALEEVAGRPDENVVVQKSHEVPPFFAAVDPQPFFIVPSKLAAAASCESPSGDLIRGALRRLGYTATRSHCKAGSIKTNAPWEDVWWIIREWVRQRAPIKAKNIPSHHPAVKILGEELLGRRNLDVDMAETEASNETKEESHVGETNNTGEPNNTGETNNTDEAMAPSRDDAHSTASVQVETHAADDQIKSFKDMSLDERKRTLVLNSRLEKEGKMVEKPGLLRYQPNPRPNWGPMTKAAGR